MICPRLNTVQVLSQPPTDWEALRTALGEDFHEKASEDPQQKWMDVGYSQTSTN